MKDIIFSGRPKRVYRTNRNIEQITLQDPKRVHQCLREFNDLSANSVFKHMLEQIAALEKDEAAAGGLGFTSIGGKQIARKATIKKAAADSEASALAEESNEAMIENVQKMLEKEKAAAKATTKGGGKMISFDLNEGLVGVVETKDSKRSGVTEED